MGAEQAVVAGRRLHWAGWAVAAVLAAVLAATQLGGDRPAAGKRTYWLAQMRGHLARVDGHTPGGATLFFGGSTVQGLNASTVRACSANFGIGHETARELAGRIGGYRSLADARAVVIATGLNDVLRGADGDLAASYARILAAVPPDVPVVMSSLQDLAPGSAAARTHAAAVRRANEAARAACEKRPQCNFFNFGGEMPKQSSLWEADGIHLNAAGYRLWSTLLRRELDRAGANDGPCSGHVEQDGPG